MKVTKIIGYMLSCIQLGMGVIFIYLAMSTKMVPVKYGVLASVILLAINVGVFLLAKKDKKGTRIAAIVISVIMCIILGIGSYYLAVTNKAIDDVTGTTTQVDEINVYVSKDDEVTSINEAVEKQYVFGTVDTDDSKHIQETINKIKTDVGQDITTKAYESAFDLIKGFEGGEVQSFITSSGTLLVLESSDDYINYSANLKVIMENSIEEEIVQENKDVDADRFCVYFSGIDTFGSVTVKSRSDVNIIGVVNNKTKTIMLLSTPRDYYVTLAGTNSMDKLTHAGLYGIDSSMETLEGLYDVDLSYYVRLNFSGFQKIIDELGGIDVDSEYAFTYENEQGEIYSYSKGVNHLTGAQALGFARNRHSFADGDRQRGRNQMQVIKATIEKLESSELLKNYANVMEGMEGSFQTDMTKDVIGYLVQSTLDNSNWKVLTYSVSGSDAEKVCKSLGMSAYVMVPYQADVDYANELIGKVLGDEEITQDEINVYIEGKDKEDSEKQGVVEDTQDTDNTEE